MRPEVLAFVALAPLPSETADSQEIERIEVALHAINAPVSDEEAELLVQCFGDDDCFGLAWTLLHLVETALAFEVDGHTTDSDNPWIALLHQRVLNARASAC